MSKKVLCQKSFKSREIKSQYAYQKQMMNSNTLGLDVGFFSFGLSSESRSFEARNMKMKKAMISSSAECFDYMVEMDTNPPPIEPSFQFVVDATTTEVEYHLLFDMYGLHFP